MILLFDNENPSSLSSFVEINRTHININPEEETLFTNKTGT